ncbi:MAG: ATP synthase F1 subunit gamma [Bacteroidales bacterium]|nr:ATP synthase F1 subunit gamma [Bacteroidales bacterium]
MRELKGRITSVASTEKITGAMKMISSAKMHKYEQALKRLVPFRSQIQTVISHLLAADGEYTSPLIEEREVKRIAYVVYGSDDGLCGAYNNNIYKGLLEYVEASREKYGKDVQITFIPVGKKMAKAVARMGKSVDVQKAPIHTRSTQGEVAEFAESLKTAFLSGVYDLVEVVYMHYYSVSRQRLRKEQILPVSYEALVAEGSSEVNKNAPCLFEPDGNSIFNSVLPLYILAMMQAQFTENNASEQAARVMAMQSASDNAKTLLEGLQLEYNKLRQQGITTELLDIVGGQVER